MVKIIRTVFKSTLFLLNLGAIFLLLLSYLSTEVSPGSFWPLSFFGLLYPVILLANICFVLIWASRKKWMMFLSLIFILLGWNHLSSFFAFSAGTSDSGKGIKIMSYNVQNFDLYNWTENVKSRDKILALIATEMPDIICFQDFYSSDTLDENFRNVPLIKDLLELPYHHFGKLFSGHADNHFGLALFSKFPIVNTEFHPFENSSYNGFTITDLDMEGTIVRVLNLHLESIYLGQEDYEYIERVLSDRDHDMESSRAIAGKLKRGFRERSVQSEIIAGKILESPYPVIVCGDFNDTPVSYTYRTISKGMQDAFRVKGSGISPTYSGIIPTLRIDYLLFSPEFHIHSYKRITEPLSDHYPVVSTFSIE